jgi:hypothetical protein
VQGAIGRTGRMDSKIIEHGKKESENEECMEEGDF